MKLLLLILPLLLQITPSFSVCDLPPDFWCDHPKVALACTGSLRYCDNYKANRGHKPVKLRLAFESGCPDSQQFVVYRLFPQLLSKRELVPMVDFKALPWGLAKRDYENRVRCHHGPRECAGNRLLSCALLYYLYNPEKSGKLLNCFMSNMMYKAAPEKAMNQCMDRVQTPAEAQASILHCAEGSQADDLQKLDEIETSKILNNPRFVPNIGINDRAHIHMQAYQMFIGDKVKIWNRTLSLIAPTNTPPSRCELPPDFWCSDPSFTQECYNPTGCSSYYNTIYGRPVSIKAVYDSNMKHSVDYILHYLKPQFHKDPKVILELEPTPTPKCNVKTKECQEHALQECVASKVRDPQERTSLLLCLLEYRNTTGGMQGAWNNRCHFLQKTFDPNLRANVQKCADTGEWEMYSIIRGESHMLKFSPDPKKSDPWILINNHSLSSAQAYQRIIHYMICLWYRGPNHDRDACWRCSYEATHC